LIDMTRTAPDTTPHAIEMPTSRDEDCWSAKTSVMHDVRTRMMLDTITG